jgi:hypothetical protein
MQQGPVRPRQLLPQQQQGQRPGVSGPAPKAARSKGVGPAVVAGVVLVAIVAGGVYMVPRIMLGSKLSSQCWTLSGGAWLDSLEAASVSHPVALDPSSYRLSFGGGVAPRRAIGVATACGGIMSTVETAPNGDFAMLGASRNNPDCADQAAAEIEVSLMLALLDVERFEIAGNSLRLSAAGTVTLVFDGRPGPCPASGR